MSLWQSQRLSCPLLLLTPGVIVPVVEVVLSIALTYTWCYCASRRGCAVHCSYLNLVSLCQSLRLSCPLLLITPDVIVAVVEVVLSIALTYTWCHCASRRGCPVHCSYLHLVSLCQSQRLCCALLLLTPGVIVPVVEVVLSIALTYTWCHCASRRGCPVHCFYLHLVSLCQSQRLSCQLLKLTPDVIVPVVEVVLSIALTYTWCYCASRRGCPVHCSYLHLGVIVPVVEVVLSIAKDLMSLCQSQRFCCPLFLLTPGVIVPVVEVVVSIALTYTWCHCASRRGCPVHCSYLHLVSLCQSQRLSCPLLLLTPGVIVPVVQVVLSIARTYTWCHCASRRGCPVHCSYLHLVSLCQQQRLSCPLLLLTPVVIVPVVEFVLSIALTYTWCHCASRRGCPVHCSCLHLVSLCQSQRLCCPLLLHTPGCHCASRRGCTVHCSYIHLVSLCQSQRLCCPLLLHTPGVIVSVVEVVLSIALTYTWCHSAGRRGCTVHCSYIHLVSLCQLQRLSCPLLLHKPGVIVPVVEVVLSIALTYTWCHCASRRGCPVHCSYLHLVLLCQSQRLSCPLLKLTPGVIVPVVEVVLSIALTYT